MTVLNLHKNCDLFSCNKLLENNETRKKPTYIFDFHFPSPSNFQIYTLLPVLMVTMSFIKGWVIRWEGNREIHTGVLIGSLVSWISPYVRTVSTEKILSLLCFALGKDANSDLQLRKEWRRYSQSLHRNYVKIHILQSLRQRRRKFKVLPWTQEKFGLRTWKGDEQKPDNFLHFRDKVILQKERGDRKRIAIEKAEKDWCYISAFLLFKTFWFWYYFFVILVFNTVS